MIDTFSQCLQRSWMQSGGTGAGDLSSLPAICYADIDQAFRGQLRTAGISFEAHLLPGINDHFEAIDAAILKSIDAQRVRQLRERVRRAAHPAGFEIFDRALDLATSPSTVPDFAARVGRNKRALERRCVALGIPSPKTLLSLARIYTVHRLAEWSHQPFGAVARALGFSAPSNYRRLVRGMLGCPPSLVQRLGGSDYVARVILQRLD